MRFALTSAILGTLVGLGFAPTAAQARWEQLGCQKVGFTADKDVIKVGRDEGKFKSIRLSVSGNKVHMMDLKVVYANGRKHSVSAAESVFRPRG